MGNELQNLLFSVLLHEREGLIVFANNGSAQILLREIRKAVGEPEIETVDIEYALQIARLWRAEKMIGGDEDDIRNALLAEVERLRARISAGNSPDKA